MKPSSKDGRRHNALTHGAFAKELVILAENQKDFDELHHDCVNELKPCGRMEEEVVLAIAKLIWRKRRIERLIVDEAEWLQEHPDNEDLQQASRVIGLIQKGMLCSGVWQLVAFLPADFLKAVKEEFTLPPADLDDEWISRLKKRMQELHALTADALLGKRGDPRFVGETASKIRELTAKQVVLDERFDLMIDKALKRLAILKTFKQAMAIPVAGQPRKISAA